MDRRKSIKALIIGTASTGVLIEACKTADEKKAPVTTASTLDETDRMEEEKVVNKKD